MSSVCNLNMSSWPIWVGWGGWSMKLNNLAFLAGCPTAVCCIVNSACDSATTDAIRLATRFCISNTTIPLICSISSSWHYWSLKRGSSTAPVIYNGWASYFESRLLIADSSSVAKGLQYWDWDWNKISLCFSPRKLGITDETVTLPSPCNV